MAEPLTLKPQAWMTADSTRAVMAVLSAEAEARFVGGSVRDALAGRARIGDVDIATPLTPDCVMDSLKRAGVKVVPTGLEHGTVTAIIGTEHFEITTLRRDVKTYGRHADVAFTDDWREDAARRDFTINAMSMSQTGQVFDYFGGLDDLAAGRVRFVGDAATRIHEDVLRLLRFFRFHAHYGVGAPDEDACAAAAAAAHLIPNLSGERVWNELSRILAAPDPAAALGLMRDTGVLGHVLVEARHLARLAALVAIEAAEGGKAAGGSVDSLRRLAAVVETDGEGARALAVRLRLSRADRARLVHLVEDGTSVAADWTEAEARRAIYRVGRGPFRDMVLLSWARGKSEGAGPDAAHGDDAAYGALLEIADGFTPPPFPLTGKDVTALGVAPGPAVGAALRAVEKEWLAGDFTPDRAALLARLKAVIGDS